MEVNKVMFGKRLKKVRNLRKLSSKKLAEICSVEPSFIRQIESAVKYPSINYKIGIAGASLGTLIGIVYTSKE